jgi:outer membrane protein assembly factor BamA
VGGLGSVAAQPYKLQQGNQMAQLNLALFLTPTFTDGDWLISFFVDGGRAWTESSWDTGWISNNPKLGISSAGIGFGNGDLDDDLDVMVNIAKPLDHDGPIETTFRFNFSF